jgi:hypothetical protein
MGEGTMSEKPFAEPRDLRPGLIRYVLRRCAACRKFLGIILTNGYHSMGKVLCSSCIEAAMRRWKRQASDTSKTSS